jgi:lipoyl(octanoyl) transferase
MSRWDEAGGAVETDASPGAEAPSALAWFLLRDESAAPGWQNMALDQGLLDLARERSAGFLRLYRWDPPCLSFGRNEPALRRYDRERIERLGLDVVRRPTGGRAVWHASELTYALAAPLASFGSAPRAYRAIHRLLASALARLGVETDLAPAPGQPVSLVSGPCFSRAVGGELLVGSRKVVGSAQLVEGGALLQHGTLQLEDTQAVVRELSGIGTPASASSWGSASRFGFAELSQAVSQAAMAWPGTWTRIDADRFIGQAAAVHQGRFRSPEWTWRR